MAGNKSIMFLSNNGDTCMRFRERLSSVDISVKEVFSVQEANREILSNVHAVIVYRCNAIDTSIFDILHSVRENVSSAKIIVSVATGSVDDAVKIIKAGASDFIIGENCDNRVIESIIHSTSQYNEFATKAPADIRPEYNDVDPILIGVSPAICEIRSAVSLVAKSQTTVLITGESGTGKDVVARLIHLQSNRANQAFVALNCATLPKDVIENELFGHEKGAFTGALLKKPGCFDLAHKGSLFFDEIAEMSLETQAKLLRALETQKFRRLGGKEEVCVDVRMIAATNKNITVALKNRELREDLYYRLSVIEIFIPPLRERKEDITPLVEYFLSVFSKKYGRAKQRFSEECMKMLTAYDWPGNVREIRNVVERALVICPHDIIGTHYIPERIQSQVSSQIQINIPLGTSTQEAERILILQTLASAGNNKTKAARILGVSRKTLHNKLLSFSQ